jgi:hypothetical protein
MKAAGYLGKDMERELGGMREKSTLDSGAWA